MVIAIILAGGSGTRVGADRPKQFIEIYGKPILAYTIEIYQNHLEVDAIEVVCHTEWIDYLKEITLKYNYTKVKWITLGGNNFQNSVINGINNLKNTVLPDDIIMVHYGAAPFTSSDIISDGIKVCRNYGMSASCIPCYQLLGTNDEGNISTAWVDRDKIIQISCPQSYKFQYLLDIYNEAEECGILESVEPHTTSIMYHLGKTIYQSYGNQTNIKITTKEDIELFKGYVLLNKQKYLK